MSPRAFTEYVALRIAALLLVVQAIGVAFFGIVELVSHHRNVGFGVTAASFFVVYGVAVAVCGWGIADARRWSRGPTLLVELLNLALAWSLHGGSTWGVALALGAPSLIVLVCILLPGSVQALESDGGRTDAPEPPRSGRR